MSVRVLIIDDSMVMRSILESALRHSGLDLAEALHAAILCDMHMPVLNGLDFLLEKQRRNLAPGVPVVMITADASDPQVLDAVAAGAQGTISKPFTLERIKTCVASLLPPVAPAPSAAAAAHE